MAKKQTSYDPVQLTEANKLYLYQLLGGALGIGRQAFLPKAVEALEAEEITPASLGYEDAQSLFAALGDFVQLTAFKGGRFYVTVTRREDWDAALEAAAGGKQEAKQAGGKGKPWKRKKGAVKPVRPKLLAPEPEPEPEPIAEPEPETAVEAAIEAPAEPTEAPAEPVTAKDDAEKAEVANEPQAEEPTKPTTASLLEQIAAQAPAEPEAAAEPAATEAPAPKRRPGDRAGLAMQAKEAEVAKATSAAEAAPASEPEPSPAPKAPEPKRASILDQIEAQLPAQADPAVATPAPIAAPAAAPAPAPRKADTSGFPTNFTEEVSPKPALMGMLTRMLPIDADILTILDEDWRVARATGTATGSRNLVTFPLRYLQEDGSAPVMVTIKRSNKATDARRWQLALVDGDDGTGTAHEAVGLEGLPQAEGGCWVQLCPKPADADPARELAQFMSIGTWEGALGTLATAAAPEKWNYPGEGVGKASRYGVLRDYLASTLARVRATDALAVSADGSLAAFDTGLSTAMDEKLYAVLSAAGADIPWHLEGFAAAGSGELGARLTATLPELPAQAAYLTSIDDVLPRAGAMVIPDYRSVLSEGLDRLPQGWLREQVAGTGAAAAFEALAATTTPADHTAALRTLSRAIADEPASFRRICRALDDAIDLSMRRARASYRHVAPAYDAARNKMLLLLPLALVDETHADCALALELMPSGAYQAASVVALPRAYAAARVVSAEQPAWLTPEVLG